MKKRIVLKKNGDIDLIAKEFSENRTPVIKQDKTQLMDVVYENIGHPMSSAEVGVCAIVQVENL